MRKCRLRHPRTTQERRYNCYMKHPEIEDTLYRGKRSWKYLPTLYDDLWIYESKSWKDRKGKKKKQYYEKPREFKEQWFNGTSWEQYSELYDRLNDKGIYFENYNGWWSRPAIERKSYIWWYE